MGGDVGTPKLSLIAGCAAAGISKQYQGWEGDEVSWFWEELSKSEARLQPAVGRAGTGRDIISIRVKLLTNSYGAR